MSRALRNQRPARRQGPDPTMRKRKAMAVRGAQYSPSMEKWIGFLFDGLQVILFDARTSRARALQDAHGHYDRVFAPPTPLRQWVPRG